MPSPALVERIIVSTADDLGAPADHQGAGLVNTLKAVQLAQSIGDRRRPGQHAPGRPAAAQRDARRRRLADLPGRGHQRGRPPADDHAEPVGPADDERVGYGQRDAELRVADVRRRRGQHRPLRDAYVHGRAGDRLPQRRHHLEWHGRHPTAGANVEETLFDPQGRVAAYSLLGSDQTGFGHVEVRQPARRHVDGGDLHRQQHRHSRLLRAGAVRLLHRELPLGGHGVVARDPRPGASGSIQRHRPGRARPATRATACTWAPAAPMTGASRSWCARSSRSGRTAGASPAA